MKKIEEWVRDETCEKQLLQMEAWLARRPLLNKVYCRVIIEMVGLTDAETIFSFFWKVFFVFMVVVMAVVCLLMAVVIK